MSQNLSLSDVWVGPEQAQGGTDSWGWDVAQGQEGLKSSARGLAFKTLEPPGSDFLAVLRKRTSGVSMRVCPALALSQLPLGQLTKRRGTTPT